jgi:cob(I)alamin adenosyltransferase
MMQARLKLFEKEANFRAEMQAKIDDLTVKNQEVLQQVEQTQHYRVQAESNDAIVQEKSRIQSALNDTMRELGTTKNSLDSITQELNLKNKEVEEMKSRISELEKLVPPAPKVVKKITVKTEEKPVEISATETEKIKVEVGGTF